MKLSATALVFGLGLCLNVHAEIYKYVDEHGRVTYSNVPIKGAKKLNLDPLNSASPGKPRASSTPSDFPKVDDDTQKKRDDVRHKLLAEELANEQSLLEQAKKELAEGEAVRLGDERHNYQKYLDRVQKLKDNVALHEKNIAALKKEIGDTK